MVAVRMVLMLVCLLALLMGLLWIGQGLGLIMWPASSFMLADRQWAINGAILVATALAALVLLRRGRGLR